MAVPHIAHTWNNNDVITATLLNALETDLASAGITTVTVNMVAAGTPATGSFTSGVLTLNVPATNSGSTVSDATSTVKGILQLAGDLTGTAANPQLATVGTAGTFGSAGQSLQITTDAKGRITATATNPITAATVGLGNVNNTSDANKPISTAQAAVNAVKADLVGGVIPTSQIPSFALETVVPVANRAAMLALTTTQVQPGDVAVDTSNSNTRGSYMLTAADPSVIGNWVLLNAPLDVVQSVNGQQGTVVLAAADVGAAPSSLTTTVAQNTTAINGRAPLLTPTATQTAPYTAAANDLAIMNVTAGATTLTLPTAPADKTLVGVRANGATPTTPLTVNRGGATDTIGTSGATSTVFLFAEEVSVFQYDATNTRWLGISNIKSQAALDTRYSPSISPLKPTAASTSVAIFRDTFTDTDNVSLTAHTSDVSSGAWTAVNGTFKISGGKLTGNSLNDNDIAVINVPGSGGNFTFYADVMSSTATGGGRYAAQVIFAYTDSSNYFYLVPLASITDGNQWLVYRVTNNTHTLVWQSRTNAPSSGTTYTIRIDRIGPDITITIGGVEYGTFSDNQGLASTNYGIRLGKGSAAGSIPPTWDNFLITLSQAAIYNWPRLAKDVNNPIATLNTATRTDTATYTSGSATITDASIVATDRGRPLKTATGIPSGSYVGTVTPGTSFLLSSLPTAQSNVNATASVTNGSIVLGYWNGADLNDPCVAWDPVNSRWVLAGTGYFNDSTDPGIQTIGVYYAQNLEGPWTPDSGNPVFAYPADGRYNMNGGLVWWIDRWILSSGITGSAISFYSSPDLKTWTRLPNTFGSGVSGNFDSGNVFDSFLRVRQDGVTIEHWYAATQAGGNGSRKLGMAYSRDGAQTWVRSTTPALNPPLFDIGGGGGSNYFAEPSVFVPAGKEGKEMIVFYDFSFPDNAGARRIGQAITVDGGATWHHRIALTQSSGWESNQVFDSHIMYDRGRFHLFYGGANTNGAALNLNIQIGHASNVWDGSTLLVAGPTG